jgi:hypothetical protein
LDAVYALIVQDNPDPAQVDRTLDEPLPSEMDAQEKRRRELRRIADENREAAGMLMQAAQLRKA